MNDQQLQDVIASQMGVIPQTLRDLLTQGEPAKTCSEIATSLELDEVDLEEVIDETYFLMLGLTLKSEFRESLSEALGNAVIASKVYEALNADFLKKIDSELEQLEQNESGIENTTATGASTENIADTNSLAQKIQINRTGERQAINHPPLQAAAANSFTPPSQASTEPEIEIIPGGAEQNDAPETAAPTVAPEDEAVVTPLQENTFSSFNPKSPIGTIIDEKLSRVVKSPRENVTVNVGAAEPYKGSDPYREPLE